MGLMGLIGLIGRIGLIGPMGVIVGNGGLLLLISISGWGGSYGVYGSPRGRLEWLLWLSCCSYYITIVTVGLVRSFLRVGCGLLFQGRGLLSGGRWCSRGGRRRGDLSGLRCRSFYVRCSGICLIGGCSASRWYRVCG